MAIEGAVSGFISSTINNNCGDMPLQTHYLFGTSSQQPLLDGGSAAAAAAGTSETSHELVRSLLFSLSILKDKVNEVESFANVFLVQKQYHQPLDELALGSMAHLLQEIIESSSCMLLNCEQMALGSLPPRTFVTDNNGKDVGNHDTLLEHHQQVVASAKPQDDGLGAIAHNIMNSNWYNIPFDDCSNNYTTSTTTTTTTTTTEEERDGGNIMTQEREVSQTVMDHVVELDAEDLLARYTHYCQVCGRGFKREANLRMHMRAHGDEYKSSLLSRTNNSMKSKMILEEEIDTTTAVKPATRYSCPQQGCRWNKKHAKFQPLKSIVCVRNHYKRSHCPKIYMCKRCNTKQFSVLSDLKTHEKHCGDDTKWYCSCGTSFSKKDKLMDHVALFVGHTPFIKNPSAFLY